MLVTMVTHIAQVIVLAVGTFPPHPIDRLHAATKTHTTIMFYTWKKIHQYYSSNNNDIVALSAY